MYLVIQKLRNGTHRVRNVIIRAFDWKAGPEVDDDWKLGQVEGHEVVVGEA